MPVKSADRFEMYLDLKSKYREVHEQFTTLRNRYFLIECAWCKRCIRWKRKEPSVPGATSHGICPPCAAALFRDLGQRQSASPRMMQDTRCASVITPPAPAWQQGVECC